MILAIIIYVVGMVLYFCGSAYLNARNRGGVIFHLDGQTTTVAAMIWPFAICLIFISHFAILTGKAYDSLTAYFSRSK